MGAGIFLLAARELIQGQTGEDCEAPEGWLSRVAGHKKNEKKKDKGQEN